MRPQRVARELAVGTMWGVGAVGVGVGAVVLLLVALIAWGILFGPRIPEQPLAGQVPAELPAGFPLYPTATPQTLTVVGRGSPEESDIVEFGSDADPTTVLAWYRTQLPKAGWTLERDQCCGVPNVAFSSRARLLTGDVTAWSNSRNVLPSSITGATTIEIQFHHSVAGDWNRTILPSSWWPALPLLAVPAIWGWRWFRRRGQTGPLVDKRPS